jgi:hypothetical protein
VALGSAPAETAETAEAAMDATIRYVLPGSGNDKDDEEISAPELDPVTGWLVVTKGPGRGRFLPLGYGLHSMGRAEGQRIRLRFGDKRISRRHHAMIAYDAKGRSFYISPGAGSSMAHLNGQPVLQAVLLKHGDVIAVGETELSFVAFCGAAFDWQA